MAVTLSPMAGPLTSCKAASRPVARTRYGRSQRRRRGGTGGKHIGEFRKRRERTPFGVVFLLRQRLCIEPAVGYPPADVVRRDRAVWFLIAADDGIGCHNFLPRLPTSSSSPAKAQAVSLLGNDHCGARLQSSRTWRFKDSTTPRRSHKSKLRPLPFHVFLTNNFPGNCFTTRFISRPSNATLTAELGKLLRRMTSSMLDSSLFNAS